MDEYELIKQVNDGVFFEALEYFKYMDKFNNMIIDLQHHLNRLENNRKFNIYQKNKSYYCEACDKTFRQNYKKTHFKTLKHMNNLMNNRKTSITNL